MTFPVRHACDTILHAEVHTVPPDGDLVPIFFAPSDREGKGLPINECPKCDYPLDLDWVGHPYRIEHMTDQAIEHTLTNKVCSNCWGFDFEVKQIFDEEKEVGRIVICRRCQEETIGFVTEQWVSTQRSEDYINYSRSMDTICDVLGLERPTWKKSGETLKELGF